MTHDEIAERLERLGCTDIYDSPELLKLAESVRDLGEESAYLQTVTDAARRWVSETGPGQHVNTAKGRGLTKRAVEALDAFAKAHPVVVHDELSGADVTVRCTRPTS
jgi:hypothetical protein